MDHLINKFVGKVNWTRFYEMCSNKMEWNEIFIEGSEDEAIRLFKQTFKENHSTCSTNYNYRNISKEELTYYIQRIFRKKESCIFIKKNGETLKICTI